MIAPSAPLCGLPAMLGAAAMTVSIEPASKA
jgi:hypothetical protein